MYKIWLWLALSAACLLTAACQEELEQAPAFVTVEGFALNTPGLGGTTEAISEVWAFTGNTYVGAFRLPARIPIHGAVGETQVRLQAGVRRNGISAQPEIYEFYQTVERVVELRPGETVDLGTLPLTYRNDVQFGFIENFEANTSRVFIDPLQGEGALLPSDDNPRSGAFSGKLTITADEPVVTLGTVQRYAGLLANRPVVWLEVDFRSDVPVVWGVAGTSSDGFPVQLADPTSAPRNDWTKIYFDLTEIVNRANTDPLQVFFSARLPSGVEEAEVFLDNIRLLYF